MTREFKEGYLYEVTRLPYEGDNLVCNVLTEHTFLCFGGDNNGSSFVISESDELEVAEGAIVEMLEPEIGYYENDGSAKFVVVECDREGRCLVASVY